MFASSLVVSLWCIYRFDHRHCVHTRRCCCCFMRGYFIYGLCQNGDWKLQCILVNGNCYRFSLYYFLLVALVTFWCTHRQLSTFWCVSSPVTAVRTRPQLSYSVEPYVPSRDARNWKTKPYQPAQMKHPHISLFFFPSLVCRRRRSSFDQRRNFSPTCKLSTKSTCFRKLHKEIVCRWA